MLPSSLSARFIPSAARLFQLSAFNSRQKISFYKRRNYTSQETNALEAAAKGNYQARCDLAACYRILYKLGFSEGICNHLSLSCPAKDGSGKVMLMIPYGLHWTEVTASSLVGMSLKDGRNPTIYEKGHGEPDISAVSIHTGIHLARGGDGISCVLHSHVPYATALTCIKGQRLEMLHQNSSRFLNEVCYDNEYDGLADCLDEGVRLGKLIKDKTVMMMGNHGVLVLGRTAAEAFDQMYYLERAAEVQVLAMSTGKELSIIPDKLAEKNKQFFNEHGLHYADAHFNSMKRTIEDDNPYYKA